MIRDVALSKPAVVAISCAWNPNQLSMSCWKYSQITSRRSTIRMVNQEAQGEAKVLELLLITYPAGVHQPKIFTNPSANTVLFLDQNFDGEMSLNQMLSDLVDDSVPPPKMPTVALHHEWRAFIMLDLKTLEEELRVLKSFGTVELIFVVGDERMCWDPVVNLSSPSMAPDDILEASLMARVREVLRMNPTRRVTWNDLETHDLLRIKEAKEISDDARGWTVTKITYREVHVTEGAI